MSEGAGSRDITWLHISDLHFEPNSTPDRQFVLTSLTECVAKYRRELGWAPDLIFATGDIADRGADAEYLRATDFFDRLLVAAGLEKTHLFVVPGNHDVDRRAGRFLQRTLASEPESDEFFDTTDKAPHLAKLRAFRKWHETYFREVHETDEFSGCSRVACLPIRGRKVAVLPMSTALFCAGDDDHGKLWIGRVWLERALSRLRGFDADLRFALLHHPLDWLHDDERGQIKASLWSEVDLVLRGHLHDVEAEAITSSTRGVLHLAAGASYQHPRWPKRAIFAAADLERRQVRVHPVRFENTPHRIWALDTSLFPSPSYEGTFRLRDERQPMSTAFAPQPAETTAPAAPRSRAAFHERHWVVSAEDGIAEVTVRLENVEAHDELVLALPTPAFCDVSADTKVELGPDDEGEGQVRDEVLLDGRRRLRLLGTRTYRQCTWRYRISNGLALHQTDRRLMGPREPWQPTLPDQTEGRPHLVRFHSDRLRLVLSFEGAEVIETVSPIAEKWDGPPGHEAWVRDPKEAKRCQVSSAPDGRHATLEVDAPRLNYRYTLAYSLKQHGRPLPPDALRAANELRSACRDKLPSPQSPVDLLTQEVEKTVRAVFGAPFGPHTVWLGLLWDEPRAHLFTSFGRFPLRSWSVRFRYGSGVAGHAFRFARTATWVRNDQASARGSLIYQPKTDDGSTYPESYLWIVCVPLLIAPDGPATGIISFAAPSIETDADRTLYDLAHEAALDPRAEAVSSLSEQLLRTVNFGFWRGVEVWPQASATLRTFATQTLARLEADAPTRT